MRKVICLAVVCVMAAGNVSLADTFGTGGNAFTIDFVPISGSTNPASGIPAGDGFTFTGVANDYRMGTYEITNGQWNKFKASIAPTQVAGSPLSAYDENPYWTGTNVPTNEASWYEAAQFVNWLNTSTGKTAAYKFTGTQGTSNYSLGVWQEGESGYNASNPFRNSNAFYFLPTEDEWVKAAYWNGLSLQTYATKAGKSLYQGNGSNGGWNYYTTRYATNPYGPWAVGSGSQELNGTYDMMGNVMEWMEGPYFTGNYASSSGRGIRGASYFTGYGLASSSRFYNAPDSEDFSFGFRVASIPEPGTLLLLGLGGVLIRRKLKSANSL